MKSRPPQIESFNKRTLSSQYYPCNFVEPTYLERTRRNHHWLGGLDGQYALHSLRVAVAGLGGMGSNVAEILVRLGVGHIKIADPDTIDLSNINRQVIANQTTIGKKKAVAAIQELRNVAQDFELVVYDQGVATENVEEFVSDVDLVIDEIDVFPLKSHVLLHSAARQKNLPIYSGFIIGMGAHIYKFHGDEYTIEDFLQHNRMQIERPSPEFLMDRYLKPEPSYLDNAKSLQAFSASMQSGGVPIFGASCYAAQSILVIRAISDHLGLHKKLGTPPTPVMPEFIKFDPMDLRIEICKVPESRKKRKAL